MDATRIDQNARTQTSPAHESKGLLFLDLDGVLNPYRSAAAPRYLNKSWERIQLPDSSYKVWVNSDLGATLRRLAETFDLQIVWATTWVDYPDRLEWYAAKASLPPNLPRIRQLVEFAFDHTTCGKLPGVSAFADSHATSPAAWVDDALGSADLAWVAKRSVRVPTTATKIDPSTGLTGSNIEELHRFFERTTRPV